MQGFPGIFLLYIRGKSYGPSIFNELNAAYKLQISTNRFYLIWNKMHVYGILQQPSYIHVYGFIFD